MKKWPGIITKTLSIRLSLLVVCEVALLLLASLIVMFYFSRQALRKEELNNAEQTLEGTVQRIDNILLGVEQLTDNVYRDLLLHLDEPDRMFYYSRRIVESNPYIVGCAIVFRPYYYPDRELFMAYVHRKGNNLSSDGNSELVTQATFTNKPYTQQVWYTEPMTTCKACWTNPLKNEYTENEALSTFCLPILDQDSECVGVIAVDLPIALLSKLILDVKPSPNGYATLLARNGSYIVHPDSEKLLHQTVFVQMEQGADHTVLEAAEAMVAGETGHKFFRMNGRKWYVFYKPFERADMPGRYVNKVGWSVGVVYPEDDIAGDYNWLFYYLLIIALIGIILIFVFCRMITHRQLLPLDLLTHFTQRIAEGHYDESIPDGKSKDEVGRLQDHFQRMQKALAIHIDELEKSSSMQQERTKVLEDAYDKAQEADRMKTAFLHYMTNQMIEPSNAIDRSVTTFCNNYYGISLEEADKKVNDIRQQTQIIISLLDYMLHTADNETRKEETHE